MLAIDFPPQSLIAVEYLGLTPVYATAELQKDVLRRALSELLPSSQEMIDIGDAQSHQQHAGLYVRCIQCDAKGNLQNFAIRLQEDPRSRPTEKQSRSLFKIMIQQPDQQTQTWTVEIGQRMVSWYPLLKTDRISSDGKLTPKNFVVEQCLKDVNCPKTQLYNTTIDCNNRIQQWQGRRVDLSALNSANQRASGVLPEKIPFIPDVRSQNLVRTSILSKDSSFIIKTTSKALKSGKIGDLIPVELNTSAGSFQKNKTIDARVIDDNEVEIVR